MAAFGDDGTYVCGVCGWNIGRDPNAKCTNPIHEKPAALTSKERSRPQMTPQKSRVEYIQELARYLNVDVPKHVFPPSRELERILEAFADALEKAESWESYEAAQDRKAALGLDDETSAPMPEMAHLDAVQLRRIIDRHVKWRERAMPYLNNRFLNTPLLMAEFDGLAEFLEQSNARLVAQSPEKTNCVVCDNHPPADVPCTGCGAQS